VSRLEPRSLRVALLERALLTRGRFNFTGTSRLSPYGSRISVRLWHDLGGSLGLRVLRLPRRLWTCSHLHLQLCLPLLLPRSPLYLWRLLLLSSLALEPKGRIPVARLLVSPHLDICTLVPAIQFQSPTHHAFRSPLSLTIRTSFSLSQLGPRYPLLPVFPLRPRTCASLGIGRFILRISGSTSPHHLLSLLCLPQTSALILILPPGVAGS